MLQMSSEKYHEEYYSISRYVVLHLQSPRIDSHVISWTQMLNSGYKRREKVVAKKLSQAYVIE